MHKPPAMAETAPAPLPQHMEENKVTLLDLITLLDAPLRMSGVSDTGLADRVDIASQAKSKPGGLSEVPSLHGAFPHKPKDVLLNLARATRPLYDNDVHDTYRFWAILRYIGIFADNGTFSYTLSEAASRVVGNQRRVLSEELGIVVSIGVAERWLAGVTGRGPIRTIDVDVALSEASPEVARMRKAVKGVGPNRPH